MFLAFSMLPLKIEATTGSEFGGSFGFGFVKGSKMGFKNGSVPFATSLYKVSTHFHHYFFFLIFQMKLHSFFVNNSANCSINK